VTGFFLLQIMSKPSFVVEVSKGGNKKLAMHCVFPASEDYAPAAEHEPGDPYGWTALCCIYSSICSGYDFVSDYCLSCMNCSQCLKVH